MPSRHNRQKSKFQFALPRGERPRRRYCWYVQRRFNSRSRVGSDIASLFGSSLMRMFQFALPRGERHKCRGARSIWKSFNSRSRVGSDADAVNLLFVLQVSIRAPAWGATPPCRCPAPKSSVSIRAPAWGATRFAEFYTSPGEFQFALPRGERLVAHFEPPVALWFQFALPRGERQVYVESREDIVKFQFALPRGERPYRCCSIGPFTWFQFALPRGERPGYAVKTQRLTLVSIRAPAWGATFKGLEFICNYPVSIRAPAWGATFTTSCW